MYRVTRGVIGNDKGGNPDCPKGRPIIPEGGVIMGESGEAVKARSSTAMKRLKVF